MNFLLHRCYFVYNKDDHSKNADYTMRDFDNSDLITCVNANRCKLIPVVAYPQFFVW